MQVIANRPSESGERRGGAENRREPPEARDELMGWRRRDAKRSAFAGGGCSIEKKCFLQRGTHISREQLSEKRMAAQHRLDRAEAAVCAALCAHTVNCSGLKNVFLMQETPPCFPRWVAVCRLLKVS